MAHTLTLSSDTSTANLAVASGTGIYLSQFVPPSSDRKATRVGPSPGIYGQRTIASTMADQDAKITCLLVGTSANNVEAQLNVVILLLEQARIWEESRTGSPVRLAWKRQGTTNTAYWTVTGVPQLPQPVGAAGWLDEENASNQLTFDMVLTLEPVAHAATTDALASGAITTVVGSDTLTAGVATNGNIDGPVTVTLYKGSAGNDWTQVWIAQIVGTPDVHDYSGTVEAGTYGGQCFAATYTSPTVISLTGAALSITTLSQQRVRGFIRVKVTAGTASKLQARMRVNIGTSTGAQVATLPWVTYAGTSGSYYLMDLGAVPALTNLQNRVFRIAAAYYVTVELQTTDGSSITIRADYSTFMLYYGLTKLTGFTMALGDEIDYEDIMANNGATYYAPRQDTQAYTQTTGTAFLTNATRQGRLSRHPGNTTPRYWVEAQGATAHLITDTGTLVVNHLPCYTLGFRGGA